ncbi:hypothetical protein DAEQUDRAFT_737941 [Daedalea quercina L-15889]|uniref:Uncharacterized protein n=1 Tax=Daedalea quercina L-15889 TaxID=1314783 RepID=A0A165QNM0_9APHY|nr:hypothetical protein DAEQUDRAFT_737941 [Daedalea quercina L-15889]
MIFGAVSYIDQCHLPHVQCTHYWDDIRHLSLRGRCGNTTFLFEPTSLAQLGSTSSRRPKMRASLFGHFKGCCGGYLPLVNHFQRIIPLFIKQTQDGALATAKGCLVEKPTLKPQAVYQAILSNVEKFNAGGNAKRKLEGSVDAIYGQKHVQDTSPEAGEGVFEFGLRLLCIHFNIFFTACPRDVGKADNYTDDCIHGR